MNFEALVNSVVDEEGYSSVAYYDTEGYPTMGIGMRLGPKHTPLHHYDFAMPYEAARLWTRIRLRELEKELSRDAKLGLVWGDLGPVRQEVLVNMAYQLGVGGLRKFVKMICALLSSDYKLASDEMLDSKWYQQTPHRVNRLHKQMLTGERQIT